MDPIATELLDEGLSWYERAHAFVESMEDGPVKTRAARLLAVKHGAANALWDHLGEHGVVRPYDGTNKPPGP